MSAKIEPVGFANREAVKEFFLSNLENESVPDAVLAYAKTREGKPVTKKDLEPLFQATSQRWYIVKNYGWTCIQTRKRVFSEGTHMEPHELSFDLMLERSEVNVTWNSAWIEENNAHSYSAAKARNAGRKQAANEPAYLDSVFACVLAASKARQALKTQGDRLNKLAGYGTPGDADYYRLERLAGLYNLHKMEE